MYTHTHIVHNMVTVVGRREFKKLGTTVKAECLGNLSACHFGPTCHRLGSSGIGLGGASK